ncbi:MAG: GntR family transcriptional regulator [Bacteroidaceae bacterium]|nr:GntR family transcriptional regulator [Bacteroidaceae bacterium]MBQ9171154.1 GntR family transcriptional regulator [Bacteroidaceae bacterium]MBQ9293754.1 GntR family transcriptional regulator [Bacteroidaceae bacterium]
MDFKNNKPIFLQIAEHICYEILGGTYPEGERLPSVREYAAEVEVNANTVARSYEWLSQRGIIESKRGMGYFVSQGAKESIRTSLCETFFQETLPDVVAQMQKLGIKVNEVVQHITELCHE